MSGRLEVMGLRGFGAGAAHGPGAVLGGLGTREHGGLKGKRTLRMVPGQAGVFLEVGEHRCRGRRSGPGCRSGWPTGMVAATGVGTRSVSFVSQAKPDRLRVSLAGLRAAQAAPGRAQAARSRGGVLTRLKVLQAAVLHQMRHPVSRVPHGGPLQAGLPRGGLLQRRAALAGRRGFGRQPPPGQSETIFPCCGSARPPVHQGGMWGGRAQAAR